MDYLITDNEKLHVGNARICAASAGAKQIRGRKICFILKKPVHANQRSNQLSRVFGLALGLHAVTAGGTRKESLAEAQPSSLASAAQLYINVCRLMGRMLLWGAGWGHVPRQSETQLGMLTEAPCGRSQPSPALSHPMPHVGDHPGVACWG